MDFTNLSNLEYPFVYMLLMMFLYQSFQFVNRFADNSLLTKSDVIDIVSAMNDEIALLKEQNELLKEQNTILRELSDKMRV